MPPLAKKPKNALTAQKDQKQNTTTMSKVLTVLLFLFFASRDCAKADHAAETECHVCHVNYYHKVSMASRVSVRFMDKVFVRFVFSIVFLWISFFDTTGPSDDDDYWIGYVDVINMYAYGFTRTDG